MSVSPEEILLQCPSRVVNSGLRQVMVITTGGSATAEVPFTSQAFGIFTSGNSGCGRGALYTVRGSAQAQQWVLVDRDNSAEPGREVVVFGTGLGGTIPPVGDGEPAPAEPPAKAVGVLFGDGAFLGDSAIPAGDILFIGRAPGLVGVDQYNIRLRSDVPEGCDLPFWIKGTRSASQAVPIS
ncbi:MAG: hypothetical protein IT164_15405, partial [Bryobacterales bacterium]|nr:hypothetical protein [Bryobacterales bacterium]